MSILENIIKTVILDEAIIVEKHALSTAAFNIRLQSPTFRNLNLTPGAFLRMGVGIGQDQVPMKDKIRSYSPWAINQREGYMDLAIATHSGGVGSVWAEQCKVGDSVFFKTKKGTFLAEDSSDSYLFVGDLSALSHLYMIHRNIGEGKQVASVIYSNSKSELFADTGGLTPFDFYELAPNPIDEIISKIKEIVPTLKGKKMAYVAGDSRVCVAVNQFLRKELNWETKEIKTKPFWNPEKTGLE